MGVGVDTGVVDVTVDVKYDVAVPKEKLEEENVVVNEVDNGVAEGSLSENPVLEERGVVDVEK